jgi:hypothetical protein
MFFPLAPSRPNQFLNQHIQWLAKSFEPFFETPLLATEPELLAEKLFYAPFVLLSHNTEADPIFNYANQLGLELFELHWSQLITLPSRLSAEPVNQIRRNALMKHVSSHGYIDNYAGIRLSSQGTRFQIKHAKIWNISDSQGAYYGQAACFSHWDFL